LRMKDIPKAEQSLEQMNAALQNDKLRKSDRDQYFNL